MREQDAQRLAEGWVADWNAHDLEAIMRHYAEDVEFRTPTVIDTLGIEDGRIEGAARLREHFARGLERLPQLRFELDRVYAGVAGSTLAYRWHDGTEVVEIHEYDENGLIRRAEAMYAGLAW